MKKLCFFIAFSLLLPLMCGSAAQPEGNGLFCWDSEAVEEAGRQELFDRMDSAGATVLYQYFSEEGSKSCIRSFLTDAAARGIQVYYLTGEPEWSLDPEGEQMLAQVRRAARINKKLPEQARLRGVLMDAEPYLTDRWEGNEDETLARFAQAMGKVHESAAERGLVCALCIPFYYDNSVRLERLAELIRCCDSLAIMNYSKYDEAEHIAAEIALAGSRPVTVIYELQEPGRYGLQESNTYFYDGLEAVEESFRKLKTIFDREDLSFALHDYEALKEMEENE